SPRVAEIPESQVEPVFAALVAQQLEKPFLEAPRDDSRRAVRFVVARCEDRVAAPGKPVGQVDADRLAAGVSKLKPTFGLDEALGHTGERNHRADRADGMDHRPAAEKAV